MEVPELTPEMIAEFPPAAVDFIRQLLKIIEAQAVVINRQSIKISELEARLNLNSRNSSKPPSSGGPSVKQAPPKPKHWNKPGGQPGQSEAESQNYPDGAVRRSHRLRPVRLTKLFGDFERNGRRNVVNINI